MQERNPFGQPALDVRISTINLDEIQIVNKLILTQSVSMDVGHRHDWILDSLVLHGLSNVLLFTLIYINKLNGLQSDIIFVLNMAKVYQNQQQLS